MSSECSVVAQSYDKLQYESYCYPSSQPQNLHIVSHLFGAKTVHPKKARVLEIGCASGGNLFVHAHHFPHSDVVGFDISAMQTKHAHEKLSFLNYHNLDFFEASISEVDPTIGLFDYIIVHGVFSWVGDAIRHQILEFCQRHLSNKGVALISFNCLPGWNLKYPIRALLQGLVTQNDLAEVKAILASITCLHSDNDRNTYYKELTQSILNGQDSYIVHEYLEHDNRAFYLHEFVRLCERYHLHYLCDAEIEKSNVQQNINSLVGADKPHWQKEQYSDFLLGQCFRGAIITKNSKRVDRDASVKLDDFYVKFNTTENPTFNITNVYEGQPFYYALAGGNNVCVKNIVLNLALMALKEQGVKPVQFKKLVLIIFNKLQEHNKKHVFSRKQIHDYLGAQFLQLIRVGGVKCYVSDFAISQSITDYPKAFSFSRMDATAREIVTNALGNGVKLSASQRSILPLLDGSCHVDQLKALLPDVSSEQVLSSLKFFAAQGLLVE